MANILVQKFKNNKVETTPALKALKDTVEMIRQRAFELFERRGHCPGNELADWVQAERDLFWVPPAELAETEKEVEITVAVPGFDPGEVRVFAQPGEILIQGNHDKRVEEEQKGVLYSEFEEKTLYRRFEVAQGINVDHVTANIENGLLTVKARKYLPADRIAAAA